MKNVFKFLGIAFVACSMFVACGDDVETFTIKVKANDSSMGTVTGGGKYESGATATLEATPTILVSSPLPLTLSTLPTLQFRLA